MLHDFHFLAPAWLLALLPLAVLLWAMVRGGTGAGAWGSVVDPHLLPHLIVPGGGKVRRGYLVLLALAWTIAVLALANPTVERLPAPLLRSALARVVVLDVSRSMTVQDLTPSRLARARYKVADILKRSAPGQVGLIVYAGEPFAVAPLTDDAETILALLDGVSPEIMPVRGSRPDKALALAGELLQQATARRGEVILLADSGGDERALAAARALVVAGHRLGVIGVGTAAGAVLPGDRDARPNVLRLDTAGLEALARAGEGAYAPLSADERDLERVLGRDAGARVETAERLGLETAQWIGLGPWIALLLLPLGALAFRRGWLLGLLWLAPLGLIGPGPAYALGWEDLWWRTDQQAAAALAQEDYRRVLEIATDPMQRGVASYRLGDYPGAAAAFAEADTADAHYNRGNALAQVGLLGEAIDAYDQALALNPDMQDAFYNRAKAKWLLRQLPEGSTGGAPGGEGGGAQGAGTSAGAEGSRGTSSEQRLSPSPPQDASAGSDGGAPPGEGSAEGEAGAGERRARADSADARPMPSPHATPDAGRAERGAGAAATDPRGGSPGSDAPRAAPRTTRGDSDSRTGIAPVIGSSDPPTGGAPGGPPENPAAGSAGGAAGDGPGDAPAPGAGGAGSGGGVGPGGRDLAGATEGAPRDATEQAVAAFREDAQAARAKATAEVIAEDEADKEATAGGTGESPAPSPTERATAEATEQWLRRIRDDPALLLRRKLEYQYRNRGAPASEVRADDPW